MSERATAWMPLYIGDYLGDTQRLTTEQHGAYLLLLMDYWRNGAPPADDAVLAQITRLSPQAWRKNRAALLSFFSEVDGLLRHGRVETELERASHNQERRSSKAQKAAQARWGNAPSIPASNAPSNAPSNANGNAPRCPPPSPVEEERVPLANANGGDPDLGKSLFDQGVSLLVATGRAEPQARSIIAKFQRDFGDPAVLDAINRCRGATDPVSAMRDRLGKAKAQAEYLGP